MIIVMLAWIKTRLVVVVDVVVVIMVIILLLLKIFSVTVMMTTTMTNNNSNKNNNLLILLLIGFNVSTKRKQMLIILSLELMMSHFLKILFEELLRSMRMLSHKQDWLLWEGKWSCGQNHHHISIVNILSIQLYSWQLKDRILELDGRAVVASKNKNALLLIVRGSEHKGTQW